MSVIFSDDEDVPTHAAALEQVHCSILSKGHCETNGADDKENHSKYRSFFEKDPVCLRILERKNRSPGDVFLIPMVAPSNLCDVYEIPSDSSDGVEQRSSCEHAGICVRASGTIHWPKRASHMSTRSGSPSTFHTSHVNRRKRLRIQQLRDAKILLQRMQSDDEDEDFIPKLSAYDGQPFYQCQTVLTMELRPRKELWNPEDDLPLTELQSRLLIDAPVNVANRPLTSNQPLNENAQEGKLCDGSHNHFTLLTSSVCSVPKGKSMGVHYLPLSKRGPSESGKMDQKVGMKSDTQAKAICGQRRVSRTCGRKIGKFKNTQIDCDYRGLGGGDDVSLLEIKRRCSSLRSWKKHVSHVLVDYSDAD